MDGHNGACVESVSSVEGRPRAGRRRGLQRSQQRNTTPDNAPKGNFIPCRFFCFFFVPCFLSFSFSNFRTLRFFKLCTMNEPSFNFTMDLLRFFVLFILREMTRNFYSPVKLSERPTKNSNNG